MNKMKPATILQNIVRDAEREKLAIPLIKDVYNFLNTLQKKTVGKSNMTLGELAKFCIEHNQIPDEDSPHEPFVLDFQIFDEDDIDTLVDFEEGDQFRVVITTRHLLKFILRKWSYSRDTDQNINAKPFIDEPSISLVRQPFRSLIDADDADLDENDEVDDDIPFDEDLNLELNQLTHSQRENIDRDYYDRLYCNELDVSLMNNGNMFGLQDIQPTTSSILSSDNSTLPYNMDHISNICDDYVLTDLNILTTSIAMTDDTRPLQSIATTSSSILPTIQSPKSILKVAGKQADTLKKQRGRPKMTDEEKAESAKQREIKRQKR